MKKAYLLIATILVGLYTLNAQEQKKETTAPKPAPQQSAASLSRQVIGKDGQVIKRDKNDVKAVDNSEMKKSNEAKQSQQPTKPKQ